MDSRRLLNLKLLKSLSELSLNGSLSTPLDLEGKLGSGDGRLNLVDVSLEVGLEGRRETERNESQDRAIRAREEEERDSTEDVPWPRA